MWGTHARSDGSVFYRYADGSEYYRRKDGNTTIRPPEDSAEKDGEEDTSGLVKTPASAKPNGRACRPWYDWPPQLNLSIWAKGPTFTIRDSGGCTVTFKPDVFNGSLVPDESVPSSLRGSFRSYLFFPPCPAADPQLKTRTQTGVALRRATNRPLECKGGWLDRLSSISQAEPIRIARRGKVLVGTEIRRVLIVYFSFSKWCLE